MKIIYFNLCIIIFHGLIINKLLASEYKFPTSPPTPAPFTIPTIGNSPNFHNQTSPLHLLVPTNEPATIKLSTISMKIEAYAKCSWTSFYETKEQEIIAQKSFLIQHKINNFNNQSDKRTARLKSDKQKYGISFTDQMVDEAILVIRIHALQEYKKSAQLKLKMKRSEPLTTG